MLHRSTFFLKKEGKGKRYILSPPRPVRGRENVMFLLKTLHSFYYIIYYSFLKNNKKNNKKNSK
jgi:hypothetical protein